MNRLKELRKEKKLSQKEIAKEMSISEKTLSRWENGESQIKPEKAQQLAKYLGVSVGYLLGYESLDIILNMSRNGEFKNHDEKKEMINSLAFVEGYLESLTGNKRFIKKVFESPDALDVLPAVYNLLLQKKEREALLLVGFLTLGEKEKTILLDLLESLCRKM
ncbi:MULTISPECIES: helix-turn-helix transcriptional regulator [unclassified Streptococcus]|uniref:helix-turn-helix domain-containing protein n=1 Tax=unclassified Streptococcus TaxID=2608887 RepID=UPI000A65C89A|nr:MULTISPECIES: helix-turn-helix transcriptional regulator [unclassified Streptococcus]